ADAPTGRAVARAATRVRTMATGTARVTGTVNVTGTARATEVADGVPDKRSQLPMVLWQRRCGAPAVGGGESLPELARRQPEPVVGRALVAHAQRTARMRSQPAHDVVPRVQVVVRLEI